MFFRERKKNSNKTDFPKILVFAGSKKMPGASFLTSKAAIRMGAGYVYHFSFDGSDFLIPHLPECIPLDQLENKDFDAIVIGPGLSPNPSSIDTIKEIKKWSVPCVVDATSLHHLSEKPISLNSSFLITPHEGEAAKLLHIDSKQVVENKKKAALDLSEKYHCHVLLKGSPNYYAYKNEVKEIDAGNPALASAGSGDVLSGMLACAIGHIGSMEKEQILSCVKLHGDLAVEYSKDFSLQSLGASDLLEILAKKIKDFS